MRFEFQVNLRSVQQIAKKAEIKKESPLRQSLILAYQIEDLLDKERAQSLSAVAVWLNMCNARVSQIMNLLCLAPVIQTEILIRMESKPNKITEYQIREIAMETSWAKQLDMWRKHVG